MMETRTKRRKTEAFSADDDVDASHVYTASQNTATVGSTEHLDAMFTAAVKLAIWCSLLSQPAPCDE